MQETVKHCEVCKESYISDETLACKILVDNLRYTKTLIERASPDHRGLVDLITVGVRCSIISEN
jgi:hypothetical protein